MGLCVLEIWYTKVYNLNCFVEMKTLCHFAGSNRRFYATFTIHTRARVRKYMLQKERTGDRGVTTQWRGKQQQQKHRKRNEKKRTNMKWYLEIADTKADKSWQKRSKKNRGKPRMESTVCMCVCVPNDFTHIDNFRFGSTAWKHWGIWLNYLQCLFSCISQCCVH